MKQKLTLSIEADAISRMKQLARRRKISVSRLFEEWSEQKVCEDPTALPTATAIGTSLRGRWSRPKSTPQTDDVRMDYLIKKHMC